MFDGFTNPLQSPFVKIFIILIFLGYMVYKLQIIPTIISSFRGSQKPKESVDVEKKVEELLAEHELDEVKDIETLPPPAEQVAIKEVEPQIELNVEELVKEPPKMSDVNPPAFKKLRIVKTANTVFFYFENLGDDILNIQITSTDNVDSSISPANEIKNKDSGCFKFVYKNGLVKESYDFKIYYSYRNGAREAKKFTLDFAAEEIR
jgi:hypothetical protein